MTPFISVFSFFLSSIPTISPVQTLSAVEGVHRLPLRLLVKYCHQNMLHHCKRYSSVTPSQCWARQAGEAHTMRLNVKKSDFFVHRAHCYHHASHVQVANASPIIELSYSWIACNMLFYLKAHHERLEVQFRSCVASEVSEPEALFKTMHEINYNKRSTAGRRNAIVRS